MSSRRTTAAVATLTRILVLLLASAVIPRSVMSAAADWSLRDYIETAWTHHDGLPLANPRAILQSTDGYLWIVTQGEGLLRFDGMRFVSVPFPCDHPIVRADTGPDGSVWAICGNRLLRRTGRGEVVEIPQKVLWSVGTEPTLHIDSRGRVWVVGRSDHFVGYLAAPDGTDFKEFYNQSDRGIVAWTEDSEDAIWVSDVQRVLRIGADHIETVPLQDIYALTRAPSGGVFACSRSAVWHLDAGAPRIVARAPEGVSFSEFGKSISATADGRLWIGTRQHGIALMHGDGRVELLPDTKRMGGLVNTVLVDREETIWAGATSGLHRFRKPRARVLSSLAERLPGVPGLVFVDSRDELWVNSRHPLIRMNPLTGALQEISGDYHAIAEDKAGRLWLASKTDLGYLESDRFVPIRDHAGAPVPNVYSLARDSQGELWALSEGVGLYRVTPGPPRLVLSAPQAANDFVVSSRHGTWIALWKPPSGSAVTQYVPGRNPVLHDVQAMLPGAVVWTIWEDGDAIWIGTSRGLLRWRHTRWTIWTREHGLPGEGAVVEIATDRFDRIWLMTSGGILAVPRAQLDVTPDGAPRALTFARIGNLDRVIPHVGGMRTSPRVSADRNGQLYFATFDSVAVVDPSAVSESSLEPSIAIESVTADNQPVDLTTAATLRLIEPSRLEFDYTSLSLQSPENIRFRYKLEGYHANWIEAGGQRRVTFGALKPGRYRFRVIGSGSEGVWNEEGAAVAFQIAPLFWHTWWFAVTLVGLAAAALLGVHGLRMRRLTRQLNVRFEAQLAERMRIAQDLHDTLVQSTAVALLHVQMADKALTGGVPSTTSALDRVLPSLRLATQILSGMSDESRAAVQGLRAKSASGDLAEALRQAGGDQPDGHTIDFRVNVEGSVRALQPPVGEEVYWIAREALVNAYQHANARRIRVDLVYTRTRFRCIVRDDGCGIDPRVLQRGREGHWGLTGMRERAERVGAELHVRRAAGGGTEVELRVTGQLAFGETRLVDRVRQWLRRRRRRPENL